MTVLTRQREDGSTPTSGAASETCGDIEEGKSAYRPGGFHPVYIGDVYNDRYKVLNKIGYGVYSTVWLVRDLQQQCVFSTPIGVLPYDG